MVFKKSDPQGQDGHLLMFILVVVAVILALNMAAVTYPVQVLLPLVKAIYLVFVNIVYGYLFLRFVYRRTNLGIPIFTVFATGLIFTFLFFYFVSFFKLLTTPVILVYFLVPLPLVFFLQGGYRDDFLMGLRVFFKRPAREYLVLIFPLIYAALPSTFYDALSYHLGIPNLYLQGQGFVAAPQLFYANTSIYYEILLIPALFAGDLVPRLFHFFIGGFLIFATVDFAVEHLKIRERFVLVLTIVSMPMSIFLFTAVKNDLASVVFILPAMHWLLKKRPYLSAIFWGFSLGVKYTNVIPLAIFILFYFFKTGNKKRFLREVVIIALVSVVVLMPLMVKNYQFTGNPIFPFFHDHFSNRLPYWDAQRFQVVEADAKKLFYSWQDVIMFPFSISFTELGSGGVTGPLFLMFLPFLLLVKYRKEVCFWLLGFALLTLLAGGNFKLSTRVWYIAFLVLSMYVAMVWEVLRYRILKVLFFIVIAFNFMNAFGLQEYLYRSFHLYSGRVSIEEYKGQAFSTYPAIRFVNENTPVRSRVLVVGEARSFYLKRPYQVGSGYDYSILRKYIEKSMTREQFIQALREDRIDYMILNIREYKRLQEGYKNLGEGQFKRSLQWLSEMQPIFHEQGVFVYRI